MKTRNARRLSGNAACVALLMLAQGVWAQVDPLTTRYENLVRTNSVFGGKAYTNGVALGIGNGISSMMLSSTNWVPNPASTNAKNFRTSIGAPIVSVSSDTFLGQILRNPTNINLSVPPVIVSLGGDAVWLDYASTLIASGYGTVKVIWTLEGGGKLTNTYIVAVAPDKRPVRLYWTHQRPSTVEDVIQPLQNAGPTIQFSSNYRVELYGNSTIGIFNDEPANETVGDVRLNGTELQAFSGAEGRFLLAYSRFDEMTGKRELLAFEIVEVLEPMSTLLPVDIGGQLFPITRPFETDTLFPQITRGAVDASGGDEIYVYQHMSGPEKNWIWAIRDTVGKPWKIEVYWRAKEEMDVLWPFEVDIYEASWNPATYQIYARDNQPDVNPDPKVYFSSMLTVEAMPYQVPAGHAIIGNGAFYTTTTFGYCLLKYTSGDLVWFEAVCSRAGANPAFFPNRLATNTAYVAEEILHPVTPNAFFYPGWIRVNEAPAAPVRNPYNGNAYTYPSAYQPTNQLTSQIFPVNRGFLDVWWAGESRHNHLTDKYPMPLPAPIFFPNDPRRYLAQFPSPVLNPEDDDQRHSARPQIVIASGKGSAGYALSDFDTLGCGPATWIYNQLPLVLTPQSGKTSASFTVESWLYLSDSPALPLLTVKRTAGNVTQDVCRIVIDSLLNLSVNGQAITAWAERPTRFESFGGPFNPGWEHVAFVLREEGVLEYYLNGQAAARANITPCTLDFNTDLFAFFDTGFVGFRGLRLWSRARTWPEIHAARYAPVAKPDDDLIAEYLEIPDGNDGDYPWPNKINDSSGNNYHLPLPENADRYTFGEGPRLTDPGLLFTGADAVLYIQSDPAADGYNPNEEHALLMNGIAYALRIDLNRASNADIVAGNYSSESFVLVQYTDQDSGRTRMSALPVIPENDLYRFTGFLEAGQMIQSPAPLALLQPANWHTWVDGPRLSGKDTGFLDRKNWFWAQQAGNDGGPTNYVFDFSYPNQPSFDYPASSTKPAVGTRTGWMPGYSGRGAGWPVRPSSDPLSTPVNYTFHVLWPQDVPRLFVGDTLTNAKDELPAIRGQLSVDVVYQQSSVTGNYPSVHLLDPTLARKVALEEVPGGMKSYRDVRTGNTLFSDLPPTLRTRLSWVPTDVGQELQLTGLFHERTDTYDYLLLNVLDARARDFSIDPESVTGIDNTWTDAIETLPSGADPVRLTDDVTPFDSLALATDGRGAGYVTLVFNNSVNDEMVDPSESVFVSVIKVEPELYQGMLDPILSDNPLDRQMTLKYTADFGGQTERWEFEWQAADPQNGRAPSMEDTGAWIALLDSEGHSYADYAVIGDAGVFGLSDHYVRCRYRALDPDVIGLVGTNWANWTPGALAEGWVKRVLKAINPFEQRIRDYMNVALDTDLSMVQQAGMPYSGDIPLNQEALNDYGLIPIYETLLSQADKLSIDADFIATGALALALQMAAGRISELYMVLGNEALADALNPTIDLGADSPVDDSGESSVFAFQNQMSDLLEEELALLRGRDLSWEYANLPEQNIAPSSYPLYNRLAWNFTADIMGGEVAYVLNYGITDLKGNKDGSVNVADAKALFPQGHGDAYGHYLSAIKGYYFLLRHPNFGWLPQVEGIMAGDTEITLSYFHEKRFAMAAAAKAKTAALIVADTYRSLYRHGDAVWAYGEDEVDDRDWGVDEWATRGHLGAYYDWLTVNALLPSREADEIGIRIIDREGTPEIREIADAARRIQRNADLADTGMNPLGLSDNAVPFDISPSEIDQGKTHFEQIQSRALRALLNASQVFTRVKAAANALRDQNEARDFDTMVSDEEAAINRRLIEIYGYPYADDIGPGKNYEQGYQGPDLYHYKYIDVYHFGTDLDLEGRFCSIVIPTYSLINQAISGTFTAALTQDNQNANILDIQSGSVSFSLASSTGSHSLNEWINLESLSLPQVSVNVGAANDDGTVTYTFNVIGWSNSTQEIEYFVGPYGLPAKPPSYTGQRRAEGECQIALGSYVQQFFALLEARQSAAAATTDLRLKIEELRATDLNSLSATPIQAGYAELALFYANARQDAMDVAADIEIVGQIKNYLTQAGVEAFPKIAGMAMDLTSLARSAILLIQSGLEEMLGNQLAEQNAVVDRINQRIASLGSALQQAIAGSQISSDRQMKLSLIQESLYKVEAATARIEGLLNAANTARMRFAALESEGDQLQIERERKRIQWSSDLNTRRYRNMMVQILRNDELQRYSEAFESASQYCYLAARAYDYETGLLNSDALNTAGQDFMSQIVRTRALGRFAKSGGTSTAPLPGGSTGDPGLADIMYRMGENWNVLRGRLSFNNPQSDADAFSLRTEHFRKLPGAADDAAWRDELQACWRSNLLDLPEFRRYCLPFDPMTSVEPGFAIPFFSMIAFRKNFFGKDLAAGDNAFDSTYFTTKIRGIGIGLVTGATNTLPVRPQIYFIPAGIDYMRVPISSGSSAALCRGWQIMDHAMPLPYPLDESQWESPDWSALKNLCGNELWRIRKYPSLRAFAENGSVTPEISYNARLVGRSVWNSQWWLIIPAGAINANDETARLNFLNSVKDIRLYFKTYSFSGN